MGSVLVRLCGKFYCFDNNVGDHLVTQIHHRFGLDPISYWIDQRDGNDTVNIRLRLVGGKGGFGSQLRAQGNRMSSKKRAGNYEACRDLSGRRIRTVNQAKLISEYLQRKPELEARREEEIKKKMEKHIEAPNRKTKFEDVDFLKTVRNVADEVELAVSEAIYCNDNAGPSGSHRKDTKASILDDLNNL